MAQVGGVPRERSPIWVLNQDINQEVRRRKRLVRVFAPLGIVGISGTGRKTLAHRFANMDEGVFQQEVPVSYHYTVFFEEDFPPPQYARFNVQLVIYIIEEPLELPRHRIPLYMGERDNFCCMVLIFYLKRPATFCSVMMHHDGFLQEGLPVTDYFIVGNKYDEHLLEEPGPNRSRYEDEAFRLGIRYFRCSAKQNIGVEPLLSEIKKLAIARRYWLR